MKQIKYILLLCVAAITSCDLLDRPVYDRIESKTFYKNEKDINLAVIGSYGTLGAIYAADFVKYAELPSDNSSTVGDTGDHALLDKFIVSPVNPVIQSAWRLHYRCIANVNDILAAIPNITFTSDEKADQYKGEALFIRALCYFNLVRLFGDVPYIDRPITVEESQQLSRTDKAKVYADLIIPDLQAAKALLPAKYSGEDIGRITSGAAQTLLGSVYLTTYDYENCVNELGDLIAKKRYSLLPVYADIFNPDNANHAESIFEIQFEKGYTGGSQWSCQAHSRELAETLGVSTAAVTVPTSDLISLFDTGSARYQATIGKLPNASNKQVSHVKKHYMELSIQNHSDDNWPVLRYADVLLMYAEALNELNATPTQEAIDCINQIRRRAYAVEDNSQDLTPAEVIDQQTFREVIAEERRFELCFEGHRWFDLVRTGKYVEVMNAHFERYNSGAYNVENYNNLFPVPQREIDVNPNLLPNNPGFN